VERCAVAATGTGLASTGVLRVAAVAKRSEIPHCVRVAHYAQNDKMGIGEKKFTASQDDRTGFSH
jgi:hypothetical protein